MPWVNETTFRYTPRILKGICKQYYRYLTYGYSDGWEERLLEKADFDMALTAIGSGYWDGVVEGKRFKTFKRFSKQQQSVIGKLLGMSDMQIYKFRIDDPAGNRHIAFRRMADYLNKEWEFEREIRDSAEAHE